MPQDWTDYWAQIKTDSATQTTLQHNIPGNVKQKYANNIAAIHALDPLLVYQSVGGLAPLGGWLYGV